MTADVRLGGVLRCCLESVPVGPDGKALAGTEGQRVPCKYCRDSEEHPSGVRFVDGAWQAAWITVEGSK